MYYIKYLNNLWHHVNQMNHKNLKFYRKQPYYKMFFLKLRSKIITVMITTKYTAHKKGLAPWLAVAPLSRWPQHLSSVLLIHVILYLVINYQYPSFTHNVTIFSHQLQGSYMLMKTQIQLIMMHLLIIMVQLTEVLKVFIYWKLSLQCRNHLQMPWPLTWTSLM